MEERYRVYITPSARKEVRKLPKRVKEAVLLAAQVLEKDPFAGERLVGSFHMLYSYHFSCEKSEYRIAYSLDHFHSLVIVHLIQGRENFYDKLKRLFH